MRVCVCVCVCCVCVYRRTLDGLRCLSWTSRMHNSFAWCSAQVCRSAVFVLCCEKKLKNLIFTRGRGVLPFTEIFFTLKINQNYKVLFNFFQEKNPVIKLPSR